MSKKAVLRTLLFLTTSLAATSAVLADDLLATADARIEEHRMADAVVSVTDASGKPVIEAKIVVEQTRHAFLFGSNIFNWGRLPDEKMESAYRRQFSELLNYATLPFYWWSYEPQRGQPLHEQREQVARWCKQNGIATKGHPLAWNYAEADWLPDDSGEIRRLQMARIDDCVSHFRGLIDRWDVVNEATHFDREGCVKRAPKLTAAWKKLGRVEFTRECFVSARGAAPKSTLLINDYRTGDGYHRLIEQLVDKDGKRLYDVIGIQSHMHGGVWSNKRIWEVCERFAKFGVPLHFTEMTILSADTRGWGASEDGWNSTPEGEARQARDVARVYTMLFSHPAVEAITWWDFADYHAWRKAPAGFLRKDLSPKPAYVELKNLVKRKWWTTMSLKTDGAGSADLRGFLGDYKVSVTSAGKTVTREFTLGKGEKNRWVVKVGNE